jgi:D-alanine--poly(phosphoribitol) ligase subunit 1
MYLYNVALRFQAIAEECAERTALWFGPDRGVSYRELNSTANRLARWLIQRGLVPGDVVCLSATKSPATFACMLACLKVGAAYSLLDPDAPTERLGRILATVQPRLVVGEPDFLHRTSAASAELFVPSVESGALCLDGLLAGLDDTNLPHSRTVPGSTPAYVMFTSGSTGFPKGAVMSHANVLCLAEWSRETYAFNPNDVLTNVNPLSFDNSVFDFYSALLTGAALVPFSKEEVRDPGRLVEKAETAGCTSWFSVPSLLLFLQAMKAADGTRLRCVRRFIFGGEGYPKGKLRSLSDAYSDTSRLFNVYGPTECTCICSSYAISDADFVDLDGLPPLGAIADNFGFLILDEGSAVAVGEPGELCLLGPNVGMGYINDPQRTAASFVQNPFNRRFREIMYRTGDLVRLNPADGKLHILGRKDRQVKHMGYRIELEEIEAALHRLDYVAEGAALHGRAGSRSRLVAVVASRSAVSDDALRADLRRILPEYMIPSEFHRVDALPKNLNGKVDARALAEKYLGSKPERGGSE